jgi:hypothetical protein
LGHVETYEDFIKFNVNEKVCELDLSARFQVFTAVTMKNGVFLDVTPCAPCKNRRFGGTYRLYHQGNKNR